ncbi:TetR family transcriptional regulator [Duganella sp. FT135W]|uniref:TetR family transcriptional regulator n=1 Tax=Duganella flavida TaxID=2692175 RepID=A0A6L8KFR0_9BURK|nr:TetR/AcrR family transcriptional regulator [Duganella flavida]MYM26279.1 TetR family transcriptional regulator [Duganella flavida]
MRYKTGHRELAKSRILAAVGKGFRRHGYGGIGIDGLAKEAEVTSGAFYGHFGSKADAFMQAMVDGMTSLREGIEGFQTEHGNAWLERFVDFYLGFKRTCDLGDACAFQVLTPEVVRAGADFHQAYEAELLLVIETVAHGLPGSKISAVDRAWTLMLLLSGSVTTARAVDSVALSEKIAHSSRTAALAIARGD